MPVPAQPQARPFAPQAAPAYAAPQPKPSRRQPKVQMPADYDPRHPPIGFMPEVPEGVPDEFMGDAVMFDESARKRSINRSREEARARREKNKASRGADASSGRTERSAQKAKQPQPAPDQTPATQEVVTPFALKELPSPIECLLLTGESALAVRAGDHIVEFCTPLVRRGENIEYDPQTRTIELKESGVYHFAYSARVSPSNRRGQRSLSGLGIVQDDDEAMHAIPADHGSGALTRASFIGECKKGRRIRMQWHVESSSSALTLSEPLLFIERLK
jgi:hypothetical protein